MYIHSRAASAAYKIILALVGTSALLYEVGFGYGYFRSVFFCYFTNISNIAVVAYLWAAAVAALRRDSAWPEPWHPKLKHALMLAITVTWLVAHFLLDHGGIFKGGTFHWTSLVLHYIVPIGMILDWLLFDRKGTMSKFEPPCWIAFPLAYLACIMVGVWCFGLYVRVDDHSRWPYDFIDFDKHGVPGVALTVLLLIVGFVILGYVYMLVDHLMDRTASNTLPAKS